MTRPTDLLTGRLRRLQDSARSTHAAVTRPKPPVRVELGRSVRAWWLRLLVIALGVAAVVVLHPAVLAVVIIAMALALVAVRPGTTTGALFCAVLGFFWLVDPSPALSVQEFTLLALGPAVWTLGGALAGLPLRTRVELVALRPTAVRWLLMQLISQPLLAGAELLRTRRPGTEEIGPAMITLGCAVLLAVAAWLILPRLTTGDRPPRNLGR